MKQAWKACQKTHFSTCFQSLFYISWNCTYNVYCICIPSSSMIVTINSNFSAITWEKVSVRWEIQLHKWLRWDILPWLWRNQPSQVALMRHITLTLTQPAFTSGSDETYYPDSDLTSLHKWLWWDILPWLWPNQPSVLFLDALYLYVVDKE